MARVESKMVPLGTKANMFELKDVVTGEIIKPQIGTKATVIMFICNHCPFVKHIQTKLVEVSDKYLQKGVDFIGINSNDVKNYPEDSPEKMKDVALEYKYKFKYVFDESQEVAKNYNAACTPDFFIFDSNLECVYRGQFDSSRPDNGVEVTGKDLSMALDCVLNGDKINFDQKPSIGCNIKWA